MDNNWKQDPRLKAMDPEKVTLLTGFAEKISHTDQSHFMSSFLQICQEANAKGLHFTDSETALLVEILSCHMPEKDRKKLQFLKLAAGKIAGKKEVLLEILEEKGEITGLLKKKIHDQNDMTTLKSWIQKACMIDSIEEFENDIGSM